MFFLSGGFRQLPLKGGRHSGHRLYILLRAKVDVDLQERLVENLIPLSIPILSRPSVMMRPARRQRGK